MCCLLRKEGEKTTRFLLICSPDLLNLEIGNKTNPTLVESKIKGPDKSVVRYYEFKECKYASNKIGRYLYNKKVYFMVRPLLLFFMQFP